MADETYYSLLDVSETASAAEIKTAYLRLIREVHPDRLANAPAYWQRQAEERTQEINEGYSILSDREKRCLYDAQLAAYRGPLRTPSGQIPSQRPTTPAASSAQQHSQASSRPQYGSGGGVGSAQRPRSTYHQQQTTSTSARSTTAPPQSPTQPSASKMNWSERFVLALIGSVFAIGAVEVFWNSASIGDGVFSFTLATALSFGVACLYKRQISRIMVSVGAKQHPLWATIGMIAVGLLIGKIAYISAYRSQSNSHQRTANIQPNEIQTNDMPNTAVSPSRLNLATRSSAPDPSPVHGGASPDFDWPTAALPREISDALGTPDLVPDAPGAISVVLGPPGLKQVVSVTEPCTGSGGCGWDLMDASTGRYLIESDLGGLHQAAESTNGYYDLLRSGKYTLSLYKYDGVKYQESQCYGRSVPGGPVARIR
jgi:curved DNA-binding protein CbpA